VRKIDFASLANLVNKGCKTARLKDSRSTRNNSLVALPFREATTLAHTTPSKSLADRRIGG
jgi:hypothetical protein